MLFVAALPAGTRAAEPADSIRFWLPEGADQLEAPEKLEEPSGPGSFRIATSGGGSMSASAPRRTRAWWQSGRVDAAFSRIGTTTDAGAVIRIGRLQAGVGGLAIADAGALGEAAGLVRRSRATGRPRRSVDAPGFGAAAGPSADWIGGGVAWNRRVAIVAGEGTRGAARAVAAFVRVREVALRGALVAEGDRRGGYGSIALHASPNADHVAAAEAGVGPLGPFARAAVGVRSGRLEGAARYRVEWWRDQRDLLDLEAVWTGRRAGARLRWRGWSGDGSGTGVGPSSRAAAVRGPVDDGRLEVDLRIGGAAGARLRYGLKPAHAGGTGGERYVAAEWTAARERGRSLRLVASRRRIQSDAAWHDGRAVGAVLELGAGARGALTLSAEAVSAEGGAGAYGPGLDVAGTGSLQARTRSGVRSGARGWTRVGAWRVGGAVDDEVDGTTYEGTTTGAGRAPRVTLWLAWSGGPVAR